MTDRPVTELPLHIAVLAYPDVDELDLFGAYAVLSKAGLLARPGQVVTWIAAPRETVTGSGGAVVTAHRDLASVAEARAVVIPGGRGAAAAASDQRIGQALRDADASGARLYSVCSGALLVAGAGLAAGRRLAIHAGKTEQLRELGVEPAPGGIVREGRLCSVGGDRRPSVKSVDIAFALLDDFLPALGEPVMARTEIEPGRRAGLPVSAGEQGGARR
ncbi:DJ-1/PfpI family protein [Actinoplanes teichomyceticus]|uniref:DJ-1/PfpI family protein n=1 Tax=Actinoplanes teichomyceticus TaxID=1867 RepID=A0A561VIM9_ACTTI|nr:DJ-1/PfpI family protein [Actinoplanes teichomyceticus]TWG11475.1 DJ-1/PfpI family protein [Actinoplanes teichomyceticus]GIF15711.1 hypothetical protein Ate01nite_57430 [Actinoplanes teichomyceticus]